MRRTRGCNTLLSTLPLANMSLRAHVATLAPHCVCCSAGEQSPLATDSRHPARYARGRCQRGFDFRHFIFPVQVINIPANDFYCLSHACSTCVRKLFELLCPQDCFACRPELKP